MTALLIDSGIGTVADLAALLPDDVRARITPDMLAELPTVAALRVLATIRDTIWREYVGPGRIDWEPLLERARRLPVKSSVLTRVEIAASLDGYNNARVRLDVAARVLDRENFLAVLDALRLAASGFGANGGINCRVDARRVHGSVFDYLLISVSGGLDDVSGQRVRQAVKAFRDSDDRLLVIDLTAAAVHGRRGMSPLVNAFFECRQAARDLYLVAPPKMVSRVIGAINGGPLPAFTTVAEMERALAVEGAVR